MFQFPSSGGDIGGDIGGTSSWLMSHWRSNSSSFAPVGHWGVINAPLAHNFKNSHSVLGLGKLAVPLLTSTKTIRKTTTA
jgi:hypothetical protein